MAQIHFLGLRRVDENTVKAKIKAREWAPYSPEDKALDVATLLASGYFTSARINEVSLSSAAARLDIELVEAAVPEAVPVSAAPIGPRLLTQLRFLGLKRVDEGALKAKLKAKEWAPYSPADRDLDVAALLATGQFISVKASEVDLSSSAFRLDIEVVEGSLPAPVPVPSQAETTEIPAVSTAASANMPPASPASAAASRKWAPRPAPPKLAPPGQEGVPQPPWVVGDLAVKGNRHVKFNVVRSQVKARKGDLYDRPDLDRDIQSVLGLGNFERVAADIAPMPDKPVPANFLETAGSTTQVRVTFIVEEKPLVRKIRFEGYKTVSKGKLFDTITLKEKDPLDRVKLHDDVDKILEVYRKKGHIGAEVEPKVSIDTAAADADITYAISEGPRTLIGDVRLVGVSAFKPKKLLKQMTNRPNKVYQEKELEEDKKKIEAYYRNRGYLDYKLVDSTVSFSADRTKLSIRLELAEGRQYRFGLTSFSGYSVYAATDLVKTIEYRQGKLFNQEKFDETIRNVQEIYAEKGRLRTKVTPDKTYDPARKEMDVNFAIEEGGIVYVDHVDVEGNRATKTYVIKREIVMREGRPFSSSKIRKSQEKIMNLGFMDDIQLDVQSPSDPDKVDLTFTVTEGKPGMMTAGAGFSSLDGLIGTLSLQHQNLFGRAQRASLAWSFGSRVQDYSLSWTTPWVGESPTSLGFDAFNTRRIHPFQTSLSGYVDKRVGGSVRVGPRFQDDKYQLNFTYSFQKITLTNVQSDFAGQLSEGTSINSSVGVEFARDTRDSIWDPTSGTRHSIGFTLAGGPFFGDINFFKPSISDAAHWRLFSVGDWPFVFSVSNKAGYATQFSVTREVPVFDRFFLGGQDSLRGYSPSGEVGSPQGGKVFDIYNAEFGFPLARERKKTIVKFVTFFDAGCAWDNMRSVQARFGTTERDLKTDIGFGIRFVTPAFPIRLDYGYGLNHRPGERLYQINFGIGNLF